MSGGSYVSRSASRRYGWSIAVGREDVICPLAAVAFGFRPANERYLGGEAALGMYCSEPAAAAALEGATWRFAAGRFDRLCVAPLDRLGFDPHVIIVYGNSAQVMRLVNAALHRRGGRVELVWRPARLRRARYPDDAHGRTESGPSL